MGASASKRADVPAPPPVPHPKQTQELPAAAKAVKGDESTDIGKYLKFRDELLAFSLGEASYDYAKRLYDDQPSNPAVMALVGETAWLYEKVKNPCRREHWVDRLDLMQEAIDITKKCMRENPEYGPCWRVHALLTVKMADQEYWFKYAQPFGVMKHYSRIMRRGERAAELSPTADVYQALGGINGRLAAASKWYSPYRWYGTYLGLPSKRVLLERARDMHLKAFELDPDNIENCTRLGTVYFELGDLGESRRFYVRSRDQLVPRDPSEDIWQTVAHTHLCTQFQKTSWNIPFA